MDLISSKMSQSYHTEEYKCPSCGNQAIITFEIEPFIVENDIAGTDSILTDFNCLYCDLHIDDYREMEFLEIEKEYWGRVAVDREQSFLDLQ